MGSAHHYSAKSLLLHALKPTCSPAPPSPLRSGHHPPSQVQAPRYARRLQWVSFYKIGLPRRDGRRPLRVSRKQRHNRCACAHEYTRFCLQEQEITGTFPLYFRCSRRHSQNQPDAFGHVEIQHALNYLPTASGDSACAPRQNKKPGAVTRPGASFEDDLFLAHYCTVSIGRFISLGGNPNRAAIVNNNDLQWARKPESTSRARAAAQCRRAQLQLRWYFSLHPTCSWFVLHPRPGVVKPRRGPCLRKAQGVFSGVG
jgi:hypothetical protein